MGLASKRMIESFHIVFSLIQENRYFLIYSFKECNFTKNKTEIIVPSFWYTLSNRNWKIWLLAFELIESEALAMNLGASCKARYKSTVNGRAFSKRRCKTK